jgi:hypothetical protein
MLSAIRGPIIRGKRRMKGRVDVKPSVSDRRNKHTPFLVTVTD